MNKERFYEIARQEGVPQREPLMERLWETHLEIDLHSTATEDETRLAFRMTMEIINHMTALQKAQNN